MPKFRKRPVVIEATQWFKGHYVEGVNDKGTGAFVETLEGPLNVSEGDWIVTGVRGEKYPVKNEIFLATYERVEE